MYFILQRELFVYFITGGLNELGRTLRHLGESHRFSANITKRCHVKNLTPVIWTTLYNNNP